MRRASSPAARDKERNANGRRVPVSLGGVLIKKLHILRSVIGTIFPDEACIMSGPLRLLNRRQSQSPCAISAEIDHRSRAATLRYSAVRVALHRIASHRGDALSPRARAATRCH